MRLCETGDTNNGNHIHIPRHISTFLHYFIFVFSSPKPDRDNSCIRYLNREPVITLQLLDLQTCQSVDHGFQVPTTI